MIVQRPGSPPGKSISWMALVVFFTMWLAVPARAGIAPISSSDKSQPSAISAGNAATTNSFQSESLSSAQMVLPDPASRGFDVIETDAPSLPDLTIPKLPSEIASADSVPTKDAASAVPLPPAVQSGLTGLAALGMAAGLRRLRHALR
jgi:hypothetical protein